MAARRYLVVANQTLAEAELTRVIRERQAAGPSSFYVLVPNTHHGDLAARLARAAPIGPAAGDATADVEATEHAQHRLGQLLDDLRAVGAEVEGDLGDPDPLEAVTALLATRQFDEIILSTLPQRVSRWLSMDLPHRLQRQTGLPVTTITARRVL